MKATLYFITTFLLIHSAINGQTTLYSESFETDGEGVRYFSNTYNDCATFDNPDFFLRTNINPVLPPSMCINGFGNALTNLQGSWFWAGEDIRSNLAGPPGARPPGSITTQNIGVSSYSNLQVSLYLATANNNGSRWEWSDSINIQASLNGGFFNTVGRFVGDDPFGGDLREDLNLDGVADGATVSVSNFTKYTFNIPGSGSALQIRLDFDQYGGSEESAIDLIEVKGTFVLPVELLRFEAVKTGNKVVLNWATAVEKNNAYYAIERSADLENFREIGVVQAHSISTGTHNYTWTDERPETGSNYYRLRQYDLDGTSALSPLEFVQMGRPKNILKISPNPAQSQTSLLLQQETEDLAHISIYDLNGQLQSNEDVWLNKGPNQISLPLYQLPNGMYLVRVTAGKESYFGKLVKK